MLMRFNHSYRYLIPLLALALFVMCAPSVLAQSAQSTSGDVAVGASELSKTTAEPSTVNKKPETTEEKLNALEQMLERQSQRLDQLQQTIAEQQETIRLLAGKMNGQPATPTTLEATARDVV